MLARFVRDRRGNFTVLSAIMLTSLVGVGGLAVDYGNGLYNRLKDQRVADIAAAAGARVYDETESATAVQTAVTNVGSLNGVTSSAISETIVSSPTGDGNRAVKVTVTSQAPLTFARLMQPGRNSLAVQAVSWAEMKPGGSGCVIALSSSGTGVTATGGTQLQAAGCAVASNQSITCSGGGTITTSTVYYYTAAPNCSGLQNQNGGTPNELQAWTPDPLAGSPEVLGQTGRLSSVESLTSPAGPASINGTSLAFTNTGSGAITTALTAQGCSGNYNGNGSGTWTVTCPSGANVTFGTVSAASGVTVNFNVGGSSLNVFNFTQIANNGGKLNFGPGTFNVSQGILGGSGGSVVTTFSSGTYNVGKYTSACDGQHGPTNESICNLSPTMTFAGSSTFVLAGGVYQKAGSGYTLTLGSSGSGNSFDIGKDSNGNSVYMGGSAIVWFGDATDTGDVFETAGNFSDPNGGTCLKVGAATHHDINGYFLTAGGNILGAGVYTVANYVSLGGSNGGNVSCWGTSTGMNATNTTFVVGGNTLDSTGHAFYIGAGYSSVFISAPTSGSTQGLAVIGPTTSTNAGTAVLTEGAMSTTVAGAFYFPYGAVSLSGSAALGDSSGQCLEVIGKQVTLSGGSALASSCNIPGVGTSGVSGLVSLVE